MLVRKDNVLFFGSRNCNFYAITCDKGNLVWRFSSEAIAGGGASVFNDVVYFNGGDGFLYAINTKTGKLLWKFPTKGPVAHTNPAFYNNKIYFGCFDCNLYCITMDGKLVWKFKTSLSHMAPVFLESEKQKRIEVTWKLQPEEEEKAEEKKEEVQLSDYGRIESDYVSGMSKDYIKGKKGYFNL